MHELAIAQSIAEVVERRATALGATRITSVRLRIGEASGVVPDALTFCFELLGAEHPLLTATRFDVERPPHRARCAACEAEFAVQDYIARCPDCGAWSDQIVSGVELQVVEMEIET